MKYFKYVIVFYVEIHMYMIIQYKFPIFLHYDNNMMTIWKMLIVVKHRESVYVESN